MHRNLVNFIHPQDKQFSPMFLYGFNLFVDRLTQTSVPLVMSCAFWFLEYSMLYGTQAKYINIMKMNLMDELMKIPAGATAAIVQGVPMQLIDKDKADCLLAEDPNDNIIHECLLSNGRFLFQSHNGVLVALYKIT